jgi:hypothetical protein
MTSKQIEVRNQRLKALLNELSGTSVPEKEPARVVVAMRCAVKDRDFTIAFRANSLKAGSYFVERTAIVPHEDRQASGDVGRALQIPVSRLPFAEVNCPHCKASAGPVHCGRCKHLMCNGGVEENFFRCSPSCGTSGTLTSGSLEATAHEALVSPLLSQRSKAPQIGGPSTKLLGRRT